jgi:hypothetical protein
MQALYVYVEDGFEWEDISIVTTKEEAIALSRRKPRGRVEIFEPNSKGRFTPSYNYYQNGRLIQGDNSDSSISDDDY